MALFWRVWAAVSLVNVFVMTVLVGLAALQFASINTTLVGERLAVFASRTVAPFAASARLGLPLSSVRNASAILERARQTDQDIVALHVFDADGKVIHSTARPAPDAIPAAAAQARRTARGAPWYRETTEGFVGGVDVAGADGQSVGGILVVYPSNGHLTQVRSMIVELAEGAAAALLVAALVGTVALRYGLARPIREFEAADSTYRDFERSAWRRGAGLEWTPPDDGAASLGDALRAAAARYRATGQALTSVREPPP
jgi:hypothetical protein